MSSVNEMSKTYQYRKVMKPLLERKRRARINKCLDELKDLMVDCLRQDGDNLNKLEKADILELTVQHIRKIKKSSNAVPVADSFRSGFVHAANEVSRALASLPKVDVVLGTKLMTHLGHKLNEIQSPKPIINPVPVTALNVNCDNASYYPTAPSPVSSGYGSDNEYATPQLSPIAVASDNTCVWRPW